MSDPTRAELLVTAGIRFIDASGVPIKGSPAEYLAMMAGDPSRFNIHSGDIEEARALLGSEWKPIETAPKDGTWVLLCRATNADGEPISSGSFGIFCQVGAWWEGEEAWVVYCSMTQDPLLHFPPTHWQPLPAPPSSGASDV